MSVPCGKFYCRETRRAIERQNRIERARRRNEEVSNVRNIVLLAKENDPRILAANKAARDAKEAKRQARLVAVQKRREMEEEQRKREAEAAALARAASEERRRSEAERIRKERDLNRSEAKRERRQLRSILVEQLNYFVDDKIDTSEVGSHQVKILADMDLLCQRLSNAQLHELNEYLEQAGTPDKAHCIFSAKVESVKHELQANNLQSQTKLRPENSPSTDSQTNASKWTTEMIQVLVKAVNILPAGTPKRWEAIAAYVNQHISGVSVSGKDVLKQAKLLKEEDSNLRKTANTKAFDSFTNSVKETDAVKNVTITTQLEGLFYNKINLFEFTSHFL
ncbi:unnamed protein product [Schistosoma curassoni]|uniref:RAC_head domain-containing protein n=1 Tax=Schistosoma curassoni TaxID=6186 RepID=A0A183JFG4_9TREM|nr:unnamed protein product [Schistosoma curassoni]